MSKIGFCDDDKRNWKVYISYKNEDIPLAHYIESMLTDKEFNDIKNDISKLQNKLVEITKNEK